MIDLATSQGFRILLLDTKSSNPNHYICIAIERALVATSGVDLVIKAELHNAVSEAVKYGCNLFIAFDGEELERGICSSISVVCGFSVLWVTEDPYELSANLSNADIFDLIFTNDSGCVSSYGEKGRHLPLAGAKPFHLLPIEKRAEALRYDFFFAGTAWPNRVELLKDLLETDRGVGTIRAKIALPTNEHLPPTDLKLPISQVNWRTSPVDFARFANISVCTLVLPRIFSLSGRDFAETPPPRLYEAALAGTVQLVHSKLTEARKYFRDGDDFLYFDTAADLAEKVADLRADISWRNEIAQRAQAKALVQHCYEHRIIYLLEEVRALRKRSCFIEPIRSNGLGKTKVLFVVHNVVENGVFGGIEAYLKQISIVLAEQFEVYFYVPELHTQSKSTVIIDSHGQILKKYEFSQPALPWQLSCEEREEAFASAMAQFEISLVHFHHFIGHVPSLVEIAKSFGATTVFSFHDYYSICHNFTLLSFKGAYCHPDKISSKQCDVCLWSSYHILPGSQAARRAYWDWLVAAIDTLVFNTQGSYELTASIYPAVSTHKNVVVLPVPIMPDSGSNFRNNLGLKPFKVAILGNFLRHKGADIIARAFPYFENSNVEFHIFGHVESQYQWLEAPNVLPFVYVHGGYKPGDFPPELYDCHVSLHLSIWPETYCMTLSEAWNCGLVPIVSDIGALGERVIDGINGLKIPADDEGALIQALHRLLETPGLLQELQQNIQTAPISRTDVHISGLRGIYQSVDIKQRLAANQSSALHKVNLAKLRRPMMANWANIPEQTVQGQRSSADNHEAPLNSHANFKIRLLRLIGRGYQHLRIYGLRSTARVSLRYIARRF